MSNQHFDDSSTGQRFGAPTYQPSSSYLADHGAADLPAAEPYAPINPEGLGARTAGPGYATPGAQSQPSAPQQPARPMAQHFPQYGEPDRPMMMPMGLNGASAKLRPSVGPLRAMRLFFVNGFKMSGRASRTEFWWATLITLVALFAGLVTTAWVPDQGQWIPATVTALMALVFLVPAIAVTVRRLHDSNFSGALFCLHFITYVGWIPVFILCAMPTHTQLTHYDIGIEEPSL